MVFLPTGCSVFRTTAVDQNVHISRELTLQGLQSCHQQNCTEAEGLFSRAVKSDPNNIEARMNLADKYRERGAIRAAILQLEQSLEIAPENVLATVKLGECYSETNQIAAAHQLALTALRLDRELIAGWLLKARTLRQMGRREDALADYQQAIRINPDDDQAPMAMATLYQELGRPLRALTTLDRIAGGYTEADVPDSILIQQAVDLRQMKRTSDAISRLESGFQREGYSEAVAEFYIAALLETNQHEKALSAIQLAAYQYPGSAGINRLAASLPSVDRPSLALNQRGFLK